MSGCSKNGKHAWWSGINGFQKTSMAGVGHGGKLPWMGSAITGNEEGRRKGVTDVRVP